MNPLPIGVAQSSPSCERNVEVGFFPPTQASPRPEDLRLLWQAKTLLTQRLRDVGFIGGDRGVDTDDDGQQHHAGDDEELWRYRDGAEPLR